VKSSKTIDVLGRYPAQTYFAIKLLPSVSTIFLETFLFLVGSKEKVFFLIV
jgi:hypothetical protein